MALTALQFSLLFTSPLLWPVPLIQVLAALMSGMTDGHPGAWGCHL